MRKITIGIVVLLSLASFNMAQAQVKLVIAMGAVGTDTLRLKEYLMEFEKKTGYKVDIAELPSSSTNQLGQYKTWLSSRTNSIDVYNVDIAWLGILSGHFLDLTADFKTETKDFFPKAIDAMTVNGALYGVPRFVDAPFLYYREDLLKKYNRNVPKTWEEMTETAQYIMEQERKTGNSRIWGFTFQAAAYEGLTANALEWISSFGGGVIVDKDGTITVNNPKSIAALVLVHSWIGTIAPKGVLSYEEEESRGVFQTGNAVFMRNWPYAYTLAQGTDSPIKGKVNVAPLPVSGGVVSATLGGWGLSISKYSKHPKESKELVVYLTDFNNQKSEALKGGKAPANMKVYADAEVKKAIPFLEKIKIAVEGSVLRPTMQTKSKYPEVSNKFWTAVHQTLSGNGSAEKNLQRLEKDLEKLKGVAWQ